MYQRFYGVPEVETQKPNEITCFAAFLEDSCPTTSPGEFSGLFVNVVALLQDSREYSNDFT